MADDKSRTARDAQAVADIAIADRAIAPGESAAAPAVEEASVGEPAAPVVAAVRAVNRKAARTVAKARKADRAATPAAREQDHVAAAPATPHFERISQMTNDFTKMFTAPEFAGSEKVQAFLADAGEKSQELVRKGQANLEEMTDLARANVEALIEAGRIAAAGTKSLSEELIAKGRGQIEEASASVKTLAEASSPVEFFQLQSEMAKTAFDRMVAEGSALTERMVKLAGETAQPLQARASVVVERINKLVA